MFSLQRREPVYRSARGSSTDTGVVLCGFRRRGRARRRAWLRRRFRAHAEADWPIMRYNVRAAAVATGFGALFLDVGQEFVRVAEMLSDWRLSAP